LSREARGSQVHTQWICRAPLTEVYPTILFVMEFSLRDQEDQQGQEMDKSWKPRQHLGASDQMQSCQRLCAARQSKIDEIH